MADIFHASTVQTLATSVQREIERQILAGEVSAGERLSEVALARRYGVSRGPVREAMRGLEAAGLVELVANRGVVVRKLDVEEALDLYDLRSVVFGLACERAAMRTSADALNRLRALIDAGDEAATTGDREAYYSRNLEFHDAVLEIAGSDRLRATYAGIVKETHLFRRRGLAIAHNMAASVHEHRDIAEAIIARDAPKAFACGRAHVESGRDRFRESLGEISEPTPA